MAQIRPFAGCRPRPDLAKQIASLPYDVMSSAEAREIVAQNPHSFLRVIKAEVDFDGSVDIHSDQVYQRGAANLQQMIDAGTMVRDDQACLYLYRQTMGDHVQTGIVAGASAQEYLDGTIKKHELTRPEKEDDRTKHIEILNAQTGPVFLTYHANPAINNLIEGICAERPDYDFTADDGIGHTMWVLRDAQQIDSLVQAFENVAALYVADGHHRSAAASRVFSQRQAGNQESTGCEPECHFLSVIFPDDQMQIIDYNRVVRDLAGMTKDEFLQKVGVQFDVELTDQRKPTTAKTFGMFLEGQWYRLTAKPNSYPADDPVASIDAAILQTNLFDRVLGITDPRTDNRIDFVGGIRGMDELERRCGQDAVVAFAVHPVSIDELLAVADVGQVMPPKCTWFEPKLRSGLVVKMLDD